MPDENPTPAERYSMMEREAVYLLTDPGEHPPIYSVADIGRQLETSDPDAILRPLRNAGLIHRMGEFVFATPAAYRMVGIVGRVS
jgi:hypothetical protein